MKKYLILSLLVCYMVDLSAQHNLLTLKGSSGNYRLVQYDTNIFKITFEPQDYERNELVSDAVVLKPQKQLNVKGRVHQTNDSLFIGSRLVISGTHHNGEYRGFNFPLKKEEKIFGGGERAIPLNRRGYRFNLYNNPWYGYGEGADNLNYSVPFITSSHGYALFFDNPSKGYLDIGKEKEDVLEWGAISGELNVYVIFGNYQEILLSYHKLTGKQPLPPRWAFGNLMSRFGYTSEKQVKEIYQQMRSHNIPVDAIIFDLFWFGDSIKGTMGNLDWVNKNKWPDPRRMIKEFSNKGVKTILVTEPFFVETSKNYKASLPYLAVDSSRKPYYLTDFYFGKGGLIDIFRKDARQWFWKFYRQQMDMGVEAWWGDLGEPEKHPADLYHDLRDLGQKRLFKADEVHNIYGHAWTKMLYDNYALAYPDKRLFSLNRSGFAGSQRFSIFPWTGDVSRSWGGYRAQLPILLGMSMSGVPYVHSDAGGFAGGEGDQELYVRWMQFAAFTPVFRPHGTALYEVEPAAFSFPSEAALFDSAYRVPAAEAIRLRYAFLPYNYNLGYLQAKWGMPLMAPLYYYYPLDTTAATIENQYMWGENILVAPVLEKEARTRKYYLPQGRWLDFFSGRMMEGKTWRTDSVTLHTFPLAVKEGSFLPLGHLQKNLSNTSFYTSDSLLIVYVPSANPSEYTLYHDDGKSKKAMQSGNYEIIRFRSGGNVKGMTTITVGSVNPGKYPVKRRKVFLYIATPERSVRKVLVNGKEEKTIWPGDHTEFKTNGLIVPLDYSGRNIKVSIYWE